MSVDDSVLSLIETIYDAALDDRLWLNVMEQLTALMDSQSATFCILHSGDKPRLPRLDIFNFAPDFMAEYLDYWATQDPNIHYLVSHPEQKIFHDSAYISEREKDRLAYYDWHHSFSDTRHRLLGMVNPTPHVQSGITLHRTRGAGDYDEELLRRFRTLFRHIERGLEIGFRLGTIGALHEATLDVLDRNPLAILLLDRAGRVVLANHAARKLGETRDAIALSEGGVSLLRRSDDQKFKQLIATALRSTSEAGSAPGGVMLAARNSGKRPLSVLVSPLSGTAFGLSLMRPAVCVVIADPEAEYAVPVQALKSLYGLTPSESRLAVRLAKGDELKTAASSLGISYATARTQLVSIFKKTDTSRQSELVKLLIAGVPQFSTRGQAPEAEGRR